MFDLFSLLGMPAWELDLSKTVLIIAAIAVAGLIRGFSGFGAAMIYMPVASTVIAPQTAAAAFLVLDSIVTLPLLFNALRQCDVKTVAPTITAAMLCVPIGAWVLAQADLLTLRWLICLIILGALLLLISGWRYRGQPTLLASLGVGALSGVLSGVSQVSGPPVVAFWLSGPKPPATVRANLIVFFALNSLSVYAAFFYYGFFTRETLALIIVTAPVYAATLFLGAQGFRRSNPSVYRLLAYILIGVAAVTSIPLFDDLLR